MSSSELINDYAVFNKERVARYGLLIATGIRSRLDDIIEALEEGGEQRPTKSKHKQKAGQRSKRSSAK